MAQVLNDQDIKDVRNYGKALGKVHGLVTRMVHACDTREGLKDLLAQALDDLQGQKDWPWEGGKPCGINGLRDKGNALAIGYNRLQSAANIAWKRKHPAPVKDTVDPGTTTTPEVQADTTPTPEVQVPAIAFDGGITWLVGHADDDKLAELLALVKAEQAARKAYGK